MSGFASVKASLGAGIVPNWLFWITVWWAAWFVAFLLWFAKNRAEKINLLVLFFIAIICGITPFIVIYHSIRKAIKKDN